MLALGEMHLWILGSLSAPEQVAIYGAGYRLVMLVSLPLTLVNQVIPPMVAELFTRQRKAELERLLRSTASMIALPAMLLLTLLLMFAGDLLQLVYGDFFRAGAPVLAIMAAGQAINVWTGSPGVLLSMSDQQGRLMWTSVGGGMTGLLITLLLVRDFGATGVAVGYASGLAIQNVAMAWLAWRDLGIRTYAGIGQFRDAWFWLRGEQARRVQRGGLYAFIECMLWPVEKLFCALARIRIVECFGGPPVRLFSSVNRCGCVKGVYFRCTPAPPAPGSDLAGNGRYTGALGSYSEWLSRVPPGRSLIFIPGANDARQMNRAMTGHGVAGSQVSTGAELEDCFEFLNSQLARGYNMALVTVPGIQADTSGQDENTEGAESEDSPRNNEKMSHRLNESLRQWAALNGVYLIDLEACQTGREPVSRQNEPGTSHRNDKPVDSESLSSLLCKLLDADGFRNWLRHGKRSTRAVK